MSETHIQPAPVSNNMVVFKNSQQLEFRGPLIRLSRAKATFEVQTPAVTLQASETLPEFKILADGASIYSGPAVVRQSVDAGASGVCSVDLEQSSFDQTLVELLSSDKYVQQRWESFISEWGSVYRIRQEFKVVLADIQTYLVDLRLCLERFEVGLSALPASERMEREQQILDRFTPNVNQALDELFERFELTVAALREEECPAHRDYAQRLLHSVVLWAPFSDRSYRKPLGYAGDFEMVAMMFREHREGASLFAKVFNVWLLHQDSSLAHRNRVALLEKRLVERVADTHRCKQRAHVLNVGCGPALEVQQFISRSPLSDFLDITLLDFNDATISQTGALLHELQRKHGRKTGLETIVKSVQQLMKESAARAPKASYDYIYCAGLFDYLPDRICQRLMTLFYKLLHPGGVVLATNVTPKNPNRGSMEFALDWYLIYRDARGMKAILPEGASLDQSLIYSDDTGTNVFLEVTKPDAD